MYILATRYVLQINKIQSSFWDIGFFMDGTNYKQKKIDQFIKNISRFLEMTLKFLISDTSGAMGSSGLWIFLKLIDYSVVHIKMVFIHWSLRSNKISAYTYKMFVLILLSVSLLPLVADGNNYLSSPSMMKLVWLPFDQNPPKQLNQLG